MLNSENPEIFGHQLATYSTLLATLKILIKAKVLNEEQIKEIHQNISEDIENAIKLQANDNPFPDNKRVLEYLNRVKKSANDYHAQLTKYLTKQFK
jgi:TPP-dependent pyruvate/acetoin dehydrogenase alpha subunit